MRRAMLVLAVFAMATAGAQADVMDARGTVTAIGGWVPPTPGIPERPPWGITLAATNDVPPCPIPECVSGVMTVLTEEGTSRGTVTCLRVDGNQAYLGVSSVDDDDTMPWAVYLRDMTTEMLSDQAMLLRGRAFDCDDPETMTELRESAVPLVPGDVTVLDPCRLPLVVCTAGL